MRAARLPDEVETVRGLFREYAAGLGVDLCFQGFEAELADLPGDYAPPRGALLLACDGAAPVGCVALRPFEGEVCEMKRMYLRDGHRGGGAGRRLAAAILEEGRRAGYRRMLLDTLPHLTAARGLYESLGFRLIAPYNDDNPLPGVLHYAVDL